MNVTPCQNGLAINGDPVSQRWFNGRHNFRLSREPIDPDCYGVEPIEYSTAKDFVTQHHYSRSFPACMKSFGLFRKGSDFLRSELVGVAVFSPASNPASISKWTGMEYAEGAELARFVLLDQCEGNAETWFLARALRGFKALRPDVKVILSYSDPVPRARLDGTIVFPGHCGSIYSASNAIYVGRASAKKQFLAPDGRAIANRILSKMRNGEVGRRYAEGILSDYAGINRLVDEAPSEFVERALQMLRPQNHPGNHLYLFPLASDRREKQAFLKLPAVLSSAAKAGPLPKRPDLIAA